jgi:hypothetical protein
MSVRFTLIFVIGGFLELFGAAVGTTANAQNGPAHILVSQNASIYMIQPTYALPDTATGDTTALRYELTVERTGASTSRSRQGGTFTPAPSRTDTLSTVRINAQPGDRLHLHLVVRRNDQTVADITRTEEVAAPE